MNWPTCYCPAGRLSGHPRHNGCWPEEVQAAIEWDTREKRNEYADDAEEFGPKPLPLRRLPFGGCFVRNDEHANGGDDRGAGDADPLGLSDAAATIGADEHSGNDGRSEG